MTATAAPHEKPLFIDGSWHPATGDAIDIVNPATEEVITNLPSATADEAEVALSAARRAQATWARLPIIRRGDYLRAMADVIAKNSQQLRDLLITDVGKPVQQAGGEVAFAEAFLRYNADWDRRLEGEILPGDVPGEVIHLTRAPVGVVAAICPWNYPLAVLCRKVGPALLTGNTVVAKPSEVAPLAIIEAVRLFHEALDLPPGVLNVVTGGPGTGAALVDSSTTSMISFTGHRDTGKQVMARAAAHLTRVSLELGGKAPAIVWKDADLDVAVPAIIKARHTNSGQVCTSAERVLVHRDLLDRFMDRYIEAAQKLTIGHPSGNVDMGPLVSQAQYSKTSTAVAQAIEDGAVVAAGGGRPEGEDFARGYWFAPTVLRSVDPRSRIMIEETFGPVTPIVGFDDLGEALGMANDSRYGLSAYIFSRDYATVMRGVTELQFGEIYVNRTLGESVHAHHAGFKESGIGGEDGKWGLLRYTQIKTAYHHYG